MSDIDVLPAAFRLDQAVDAGVSKSRVYRLLKLGWIELAGRGVYVQAGAVDPALAPLVAARLRQPQATLCLTSALVYHQLSDEIPVATDIALPRGTRPPAGFEHVTWHFFAGSTFGIGRELKKTAGLDVGVYSAERTIVDVFRLSHREGSDVAYAALRAWLARPGSSPSSLLATARRFPTALAKLRSALEVLL
jgi:predicted transcriptional regulator of viral defense system